MNVRGSKCKPKSYVNRDENTQSGYHVDLEFEVGDHVFLNVIPKRGVVRFGKRQKLSLRFIGPFEILERIGTVA